MIRLVTVNPDNWRTKLEVSSAQKDFVADRVCLLARAYAYRESRSVVYFIYHDDLPVGMALYYDSDELKVYNFSQLFIDERYQGNGFGSEAARQILALMERDGKYDRVVLCFIEGNDAAEKMYERLGFYRTGERDGDEIVMEKVLR